MHLLALLPLLASLLHPPTASAARLTFSLPPVHHLPAYNPAALPPSTRGTLHGPSITASAPITRRNTIEFANVSQGSWLFTVQCRDFSYGPLRVDVLALADGTERVEAFQTFWGNEWANKGEWRGGGVVESLDVPVVIEARPDKAKQYYITRGGFSLMDFVKNPMILMAIFSLVMIVGVPYLTENMDEETKAEFDAIQKKNPVNQAASGATSLQNFDLAAWMAGKSTGASASRVDDGGGDSG